MANVMNGKVVKNSGDKTVSVLVVTYKNHPVYKKRYIYSKKYLVHDAGDEAGIGDTVVIRQAKPLSRRKRWVLECVTIKAGAKVEPIAEVEIATSKPEPTDKKTAAKRPASQPEPTEKKTVAKRPPARKTPAKKPAPKTSRTTKPAAKKPAKEADK